MISYSVFPGFYTHHSINALHDNNHEIPLTQSLSTRCFALEVFISWWRSGRIWSHPVVPRSQGVVTAPVVGTIIWARSNCDLGPGRAVTPFPQWSPQRFLPPHSFVLRLFLTMVGIFVDSSSALSFWRCVLLKNAGIFGYDDDHTFNFCFFCAINLLIFHYNLNILSILY